MKLKPYSLRTAQWFKVRKHVFHPSERWWDLFGSLPEWKADWDLLRVAGFFNGDEGHRVCARHDGALRVVDRNHERWLRAAEVAVDQASRSGQVFDQGDGRVQYIGRFGVVVVVAGNQALVTCYRGPVSPADFQAAERTAVRRASNRASLQARARRSGDRPGVQR